MELLVDGIQYSTAGKLDTFAQLHIARKLGPAIPIVEGLVAKENSEKPKELLTVLMLSHISDADCEYVINKCLTVVVRHQKETASRIVTSTGALMFDDITMSGLLQLTVAVLEENIGDFFRTALAGLKQ